MSSLPMGRIPYPVACMILHERIAKGWEDIRDMRVGRGAPESEVREAQAFVALYHKNADAYRQTPSDATCVFRGE